MKSRRFLAVSWLIALLCAVLIPSRLVYGQSSDEAAIPYTVHHHDHAGYNYPLWVPGAGTTISCANVFGVDAKYGETLEAVSFQTLLKGTTYAVTVIADYGGRESLNSEGALVASGTLPDPGYHRIDLASPVLLDPGTRFAVVVSQTALSRPALATSSAKSESGKGMVSRAGESFVLLSGEWTDLHTWHPNTAACVQAWNHEGPAPEPPKMGVSDMERDLEYVLARLRADHPGIKEHGFTPAQLEVVASVRQNIAVPLSELDYWFQLQRIFAMMRESQTILGRGPADRLFLDLPFQWLMDDGMVVIEDTVDLRRGDQIVSIGGRSPSQLLDVLWAVRSSENEYWVRFSASYTLRQESYLSYLGLVNPDRTVDVEVLRDGQKVARRLPLSTRYTSALPPVVDIEWRIEKENHLGYFRFDTWPNESNIWPLTDALDDFFAAAREAGVESVVFDWRNAEGAYSWINKTLLSHIETGRLYYDGYKTLDWEKKPGSELFGGDTYVLISNRTYGAALNLAALLRDNGVATIIGEPAGQKPAYSSAPGSERLPVTGWTFRMATVARHRARNQDASAVALYPDIPVYTTRQDVIEGRDAQMEKEREIAANAVDKTEDWTKGTLPGYIRSFSYVERFHYFIVVFNQPILTLDPDGITVTDDAGQEMALRCTPNLTNMAVDTLTIAPRDYVSEIEACVITLPAKAIVLKDGYTNLATLKLSKYQYHRYPY